MLLAVGNVPLQFGNGVLLLDDLLKRRNQGLRGLLGLDVGHDVIRRLVGQINLLGVGPFLQDFQRRHTVLVALLRRDLHAETVLTRRRGLDALGLNQFPVGLQRLLDQDGPFLVALVVDRVVGFSLELACGDQHAARDLQADQFRWFRRPADGHLALLIERVRDQPLVAGRQVADPRVAGIGAAVEDGDRPLHQVQARRVRKLHTRQRKLLVTVRIVDAQPFGRDYLADDGQHGRLLPLDGHLAGDGVGEKLGHGSRAAGGHLQGIGLGHGAALVRGFHLAQIARTAKRCAFLKGSLRFRRPGGAVHRQLLNHLHYHPPLVGLGPESGVPLGLDHLPGDIHRRVEVLDEADRLAAHERQADVLPIGVAGVLDDGPALKQGLIVVAQDQAVTGFPDRRLDDVAERDLLLTLAADVDGHRLFVLVAGRGQNRQGPGQFLLQSRLQELDAGDAGQLEAHQPGVGQDHQHVDGHRLVVDHLGAFLDADDRAGVRLRRRDQDARPAKLGQKLPEGGTVGDVDGETPQGLGHRVARRVVDADLLGAQDDHALEDVVDVLGLEHQADAAAAFDLAGAFEVADAAGEEHDARQGQIGRGFRLLGHGRAASPQDTNRHRNCCECFHVWFSCSRVLVDMPIRRRRGARNRARGAAIPLIGCRVRGRVQEK